jgi:hypothetical protein
MRGAIGVVLALAVGLGVGYLLGASGGTVPPARAASSAPPEPSPESRGRTPFEEALPAFPSGPVERGTGTITGRALRADGAPLSGVTVRGTPSPVRRDPDEGVRRLVADLEARHAGIVEAVTGSDGGYTLAGLAGRPYDVSARLAGYRFTSDVPRARPGGTVNFRAQEALEISFDVTMPDGTPAPDATIHLKAGGRTTAYAWSREAPRVLLPLGNFLCFAEHGEGSCRSEETPLLVRAPAPPMVFLRLNGRTGLRGAVFFGKDLMFEDVSVKAMTFTGRDPPDPARLEDADGHSDWATADRGFRYQLLDLPPGRYLVGVEIQSTIVATKVVDVGDGIGTCDFVIEALDPSLFVVVRVLDPKGDPVADPTFELGYRSEGSSSSSGGNEFPMQPDGSYLVVHHSSGRKPGGTWWIAAESETHGRKEVEYKRGDVKEIVIRFGETATVELTIAGFAGADGADMLTAALVPAAADASDRFHHGMDSTAPDAEGCVRLGPVETGEYDVTLYTGSEDRMRLRAGTKRVTLVPGANPVTMPMPRLYTVTVRDPERKPDTLTSLEAPDGNYFDGVADEVDRVVFTALPEGRYRLARTDDATGAMRITLPGPTEVVFRKQPFDAFRVIFENPENAWANAGFLDGDLIVAVDGNELDSPEELRTAEAALRAADKATLGILRAGGRVTLTVNPKELFADDLGAWIEWSIR